MNLKEVIRSDKVNFTGIESSYFLLGLLSAFENRFQAMADSTMKEISWKQFFAIICINLCKTPPTVKELAEIMGSSHQNVKQILLKLEKKGFVSISLRLFIFLLAILIPARASSSPAFLMMCSA